jgi:chromosome segregation ATPase
VGLGRGKGTKIVDRYSLLWDDDVSTTIVKRVLALCRFFLDQKRITEKEVKISLGITVTTSPKAIDVKEYNKIREDADTLKVQVEDERNRGNIEHERANKLQSIINSQNIQIKTYNKIREDNESLRSHMEIESRRADRESLRANNLQTNNNMLQKSVDRLETRLEALQSSNSKLRRELEEAETSIEESHERLDDLIETIEAYTDYEFDSELDSREEFIADIIKRLIEDIEALKAEDE